MPKTSKDKDTKLTKAEKQTLKTQLKARLGLKQAEVDAVITTADENNAGLDAVTIEAKLTAWFRGRGKG